MINYILLENLLTPSANAFMAQPVNVRSYGMTEIIKLFRVLLRYHVRTIIKVFAKETTKRFTNYFKKRFMNKKMIFLLCAIFLCSTLSWGQTWKLSSTMTAELKNGTLTISTTRSTEAMPDYDMLDNFPPWGVNVIREVVIKNNVTSIGSGAFMDRGELTSVTIPNSVKSIGSEAFMSCYELASITVPGSVTTIGRNAFYSCGVASVTIPSSVTKIDENAFDLCYKLKDVTVSWATPLSVPDNIFDNVDMSAAKLHVPAGTKARYQSAKVWKNFGDVIEGN